MLALFLNFIYFLDFINYITIYCLYLMLIHLFETLWFSDFKNIIFKFNKDY